MSDLESPMELMRICSWPFWPSTESGLKLRQSLIKLDSFLQLGQGSDQGMNNPVWPGQDGPVPWEYTCILCLEPGCHSRMYLGMLLECYLAQPWHKLHKVTPNALTHFMWTRHVPHQSSVLIGPLVISKSFMWITPKWFSNGGEMLHPLAII